MKPIVTIIGSLNYDLVTFTNKVPEGGETYQANSFETHFGGKGLNEAIAVSKLSPQNSIITRMVGKVGDDTFGKDMKQYLKDNNVDVSNVETLNGISSGVAVILVEEQCGENRILITPGSNGELKPSNEEYEKLFPKDDEGSYVILQNEYPHTLQSVNWLKLNRPNINIGYNPSPYKPELNNKNFLSKIDLLIVNEGEARDVAKNIMAKDENDLKELAKKLHSLINSKNLSTIIITLGSKGSLYTNDGIDVKFEPSIKVEKVVDTTGAGDTFFGGIVSNLALGKSLGEAVKFATNACGLAIQKKGAAEGIPNYEEVIKLIKLIE
ncbi:unnamed protein product [Candida verbasci]|uniref:Ribokinase n=1 Tax=Candida verbasci TaxID=1227364 RepID=A0A9W4XKK6_9ASCO|nr:unnamed protein product [Candida verbasci]